MLVVVFLGTKTLKGRETTAPQNAPTLHHVGVGVYAAHASTLQPAIDMLSEVFKALSGAP